MPECPHYPTAKKTVVMTKAAIVEVTLVLLEKEEFASPPIFVADSSTVEFLAAPSLDPTSMASELLVV